MRMKIAVVARSQALVPVRTSVEGKSFVSDIDRAKEPPRLLDVAGWQEVLEQSDVVEVRDRRTRFKLQVELRWRDGAGYNEAIAHRVPGDTSNPALEAVGQPMAGFDDTDHEQGP